MDKRHRNAANVNPYTAWNNAQLDKNPTAEPGPLNQKLTALPLNVMVGHVAHSVNNL